MNKYPLIGGSICAVVLVVLASLTNVVGYQTNSLNTSLSEKSISVSVIESKADGTSTKSTFTLSQDKYQNLKEELNAAKDPDERFVIYQKYGLIPENMSMEKLRADMEKNAQGKQIFLSKLGKNKIVLGTFCKVHALAEINLFPLFRKIIIGGVFINIPLPSINFLVFYWGVHPLNVNNVTYDFIALTQFIGFVGLTMAMSSYPFYINGFESWGYCILCLGEGY